MLEHKQKRNHPVIRIEILTKVIMTAHLTRKEPVLLAHAILHERMTALRDDGPATLSLHRIKRGPYHTWIEDDSVVAAVLRKQDVREQGGDVGTGDELTFLGEEHRALCISVPPHSE